MRIGEHDTHPAADAFPLMNEEALAGLIEDIEINGPRFKPVLHKGLILDGRNRCIACVRLGLPIEFDQFPGDDEEAIRFVVSANLTRRDMDIGQRALAAKRLVALHVEIARKARRVARVQPALPKVDLATDEQIEQIEQDGTPELMAAVERGDVPLSHAAAISRLEDDEQRAVLEKLAEPEPVKVQRAKAGDGPMMTLAIEVTPVEAMAIQALVFLGDGSKHADAHAGARLLRRVCPWVRK